MKFTYYEDKIDDVRLHLIVRTVELMIDVATTNIEGLIDLSVSINGKRGDQITGSFAPEYLEIDVAVGFVFYHHYRKFISKLEEVQKINDAGKSIEPAIKIPDEPDPSWIDIQTEKGD